MADSLLSPEEIQDRLHAVRSDGYPAADVARLLEDLVQFCTGADAEQAVRELITNLEDDGQISALVGSYVMREDRSPSTYADYTGTHAPLVLTKLVARGFSPVEDSTGVHVGMPGGDVIDEPWKMSSGSRHRGYTICSVALKAVALQAILNRAHDR